jgi:hypothetical protein
VTWWARPCQSRTRRVPGMTRRAGEISASGLAANFCASSRSRWRDSCGFESHSLRHRVCVFEHREKRNQKARNWRDFRMVAAENAPWRIIKLPRCGQSAGFFSAGQPCSALSLCDIRYPFADDLSQNLRKMHRSFARISAGHSPTRFSHHSLTGPCHLLKMWRPESRASSE